MIRRRLLKFVSAAIAARALPALAQATPAQTTPAQTPPAQAAPAQTTTKAGRNLPPGFESLPPIGMGTWLTFDAGDNPGEQEQRRDVLARFFAAGGGMIDSSPMYGSAEWLLGQLLREVPHKGKLFSATKVWTALEAWGPSQLEQSRQLWMLPGFDVVLVHNLLNWRAHLKLLRRWKDEGRARHIGISTSHAVANDEAARIVRAEKLDVLQITYNFNDPSAEKVMDLAASRGLAVVINRPYDGGALFSRVGRKTVPSWAADAGCASWPEFFLKWVVSHPAVTCAIPATRQPMHMDQNMSARLGRMPDAAMRTRMREHVARL